MRMRSTEAKCPGCGLIVPSASSAGSPLDQPILPEKITRSLPGVSQENYGKGIFVEQLKARVVVEECGQLCSAIQEYQAAGEEIRIARPLRRTLLDAAVARQDLVPIQIRPAVNGHGIAREAPDEEAAPIHIVVNGDGEGRLADELAGAHGKVAGESALERRVIDLGIPSRHQKHQQGRECRYCRESPGASARDDGFLSRGQLALRNHRQSRDADEPGVPLHAKSDQGAHYQQGEFERIPAALPAQGKKRPRYDQKQNEVFRGPEVRRLQLDNQAEWRAASYIAQNDGVKVPRVGPDQRAHQG